MTRVEVVEVPGEFSLRGGILDVFPPDSTEPGPHRVLRRRGRVDPPLRRRDPALARPLGLGHARPPAPRSTATDPPTSATPPTSSPRGPGSRWSSRTTCARRAATTSAGSTTRAGSSRVESTLRPADPASLDHPLDARRRLAGDDLPPPGRERRAVLGRADQGQGRARRRRGGRPRPDRLPQRGRGRAAGRGLRRHRARAVGPAAPDRRPDPVGLPHDRRPRRSSSATTSCSPAPTSAGRSPAGGTRAAPSTASST